MRRWNGWGDDAVHLTLPPRAAALLAHEVGDGRPRADVALEDALRPLPTPRLAGHPLLDRSPDTRLRHARGQSFPDWVALRSGRVGAAPDAVAFPARDEDVRALLRLAVDAGTCVIPYGGGTSVVGHVNTRGGLTPAITLSMARMTGLRVLDERSRLATFAAGTAGPDVESELRARGFTLGHFPQSFEYSTLGGWVAARSSGQESLGYGRIERLLAGVALESPAGRLVLPALPASAAGPDLRHLVLGSEGRLGVITEATVRVRPLPERDEIRAVFFPEWDRALEAARTLAQSGLPLAMLRLSGPGETELALALSSQPRLVDHLERYLGWRGSDEGKCLMLLSAAGRHAVVEASLRDALHRAAEHGGLRAPAAVGRQWRRHRFRMPYLRNTLWERGYGLDTVETAAPWAALPRLLAAVEGALRGALRHEDDRVHVVTHVSHVYPDGASLYTTCVFRLDEPDHDLRRWRVLKDAASRAIVAEGGTISHHHGVGQDHREYLAAEKGALGMEVLADVCRRFDPQGLMNPGTLVA